MNIPKRRKKNESEKIVKEVLIYIYLLRDGKVYDYQLNTISPTFKRSLQRYTKELFLSGAIPKIRLKSDENGLYYEVFDLINTNKKFFKYEDNSHSDRLARILTLVYLKEINHPIASNKAEFEEFYFKRINPTACKKTFSRDIKLLNLAYSYYK